MHRRIRLAAYAALALTVVPSAQSRHLTADTTESTTLGATFIAPAGWSLTVQGSATILEPPEADSHVVLVDVRAQTADAAVQAAWSAYKPDVKWPLKVSTTLEDRDGWTDRRRYVYETSPNERRDVDVRTMRAGDVWTIVILDLSQPTAEKRLAQLQLVFDRLFPREYRRETFAGKRANTLDAKRIAELGEFTDRARDQLGVPGVALGLVQDGKVVFAGGFGVRELGRSDKVDAESLFLVASNTKAMTTLLLAKLVDEGKLSWDTPVISIIPSFRLGDAETTRQVLVRHLVCACTGLPRQDFEWLMEFGRATPESALGVLARVQPTSKFGEIFQYSNLLAAAGGYVAAKVAFPSLEFGAGYDRAMQERVFRPLGMSSTTFDFARALAADHASPHATNIDDRPDHATMDVNYSIVPVRPAGGAWSNVRDLLKYISMELAHGTLPGGTRYIGEKPLLERRVARVTMGRDQIYGMGLMVDSSWGAPIVHHGGSMIGYQTDILWLPDHGVGAVILTNSDSGSRMLAPFRRKLLEVLFDGRDEAAARLASTATSMHTEIKAEREKLVVPAAADASAALARGYHNPSLGDLDIRVAAAATIFDFGEWRSPVASRKNNDGTMSFVTIGPGIDGLDFVVASSAAADRSSSATRSTNTCSSNGEREVYRRIIRPTRAAALIC
jgi:CubicO group peptidase (beta-lactamase class C family)